MKIISTKVHGVFDYLAGALLIASPWIFGFAHHSTASAVPVIIGISTILFSIMTNYELGMIKLISMPAHLAIDTLSGLFLAASPWIFGFADYVKYPHLIIGLGEVLIVMMSQGTPFKGSHSARVV